jgi:uncharacterized protein with GYD domain
MLNVGHVGFGSPNEAVKEDGPMPTYVALLKWTEQGIKDVKNTVDRADEARGVIEQTGGRLSAMYWTQGAYDLVGIVDWPDEESAMAFLLNLAKLGNLRSETLRAFSADEMRRILEKVR